MKAVLRARQFVQLCDNISSLASFRPVFFGASCVGWAPPWFLKFVSEGKEQEHLVAADGHDFHRWAQQLAAGGKIRLTGEYLDLRARPGGPIFARFDRSLASILGLLTCGAHVNGLVTKHGKTFVWVGKRSLSKRVAPGKLDHIAGGVVTAGYSALQTVLKESAEEASIPKQLARQASLVGHIYYANGSVDGFTRDCVSCYDLMLPEYFVPRPHDGEMKSFQLLSLEEAMSLVLGGDSFKYNVNLVLLDLFLRHNLFSKQEARAIQSEFSVLRRPRAGGKWSVRLPHPSSYGF